METKSRVERARLGLALDQEQQGIVNSNVAAVWEWMCSLFGRNKKRYKKLCNHKVLKAVHEELREQTRCVKKTTWDKLKIKYVTVVKKRKRSFRTKRDSVYSRMGRMKYDFKEAIQSEVATIRKVTAENVALFSSKLLAICLTLTLFVPLLAGILMMYSKVPELLAGIVVYLSFLAIYLFLKLAMPSLRKQGVSLFNRRELTEEDKKAVKEILKRVSNRSKSQPQQKLYTEEDYEKPMFILSLDGGGIKGITISEIIARICYEFPGFLDSVDLIAGCSTGSLVAGMLCSGYTAEEVSATFKIAAPVVFRKTVWDSIVNLGCLFGPNHDGEGKLEMFRIAFRGLTLRELNRGICITASHVEDDLPGFRNIRCSPRVWTNVVEHSKHTYVGHHGFDEFVESDEDLIHDEDNEKSEFSILDMQVADVINGATAAPVFFPSYQDHVDGGIWSNNPAMAALATVAPKREIRNIRLLSISTGLPALSERSGFNQQQFGLFKWLPYLVDFLLNSTTRATHFNVKALLGDRYHRVDPVLPRHVELNDVDEIETLANVGQQIDLTSTYEFLEKSGFKRRANK
mmetsp:Transcript_1998/g.2309  ORF Transcript_1998/g.2309 Transcript_1998/m.2309 type:complete len:573 (-) Transcript_1998:143-1861(-)